MTVNENEEIFAFIRGNLIDGYTDYCPLYRVNATKQDNGLWRVHGDQNLELNRSELLDTAGFLIVELGAIESDFSLETASYAIYQGLHSLFAACNAPVDIERFRTTVEFSEFMKLYRCNYSHIILIGHASTNGIEFLDKRSPVAGSELSGFLGADEHQNPIQIISLCCHSGCKRMSSALSSATAVSEVIAPHETFDLRWSVHFITGLYLAMYITGLSVDEAAEEASRNIDNLKMCVWRDGDLTDSCKVT